MESPQKHTTFAEFFPFYLGEHQNRICRTLHFIGTSLGFACLIQLVLTRNPAWLVAGLLVGYAFAWVGHFVFEKKNPPALNNRCTRSWAIGLCGGAC